MKKTFTLESAMERINQLTNERDCLAKKVDEQCAYVEKLEEDKEEVCEELREKILNDDPATLELIDFASCEIREANEELERIEELFDNIKEELDTFVNDINTLINKRLNA
ncbi:hypothetical protein M0R19_03480 [Candidatus Pacearchaeota archaeon]|jgi:uncharacterized coiled-coil DUF342 family protein|nr:hypothetical protein [Candidatus Pacearchaeota archaeon]